VLVRAAGGGLNDGQRTADNGNRHRRPGLSSPPPPKAATSGDETVAESGRHRHRGRRKSGVIEPETEYDRGSVEHQRVVPWRRADLFCTPAEGIRVAGSKNGAKPRARFPVFAFFPGSHAGV
jgi:hypothetical protein